MATVIDALVVELGLDPRAFTAGQKKAAEDLLKFRKGVEDENKKMGEAFRSVGRELLGLFAIFTAGKGLEEFLRDVIATDGRQPDLTVSVSASAQTSPRV